MRPGGDYPGNSFGFRSLILCAILASVIRGLVGTSIAPTTDVAFVGTDLSSTPSTAPRQYGANGTDPDLRDIFLGRCADFKSLKVNPTADHAELKGKNCSHLWQLFSSSFMYREACDVDEKMYQEFVEAATVTVPVDKATYWDGWDIYSTVRSYANEGKRSWTLEYSLVGYLINNLIFCGQEDEPGIRYDSCPTTEECGFAKGSANAFWAMASTYFGKQAKGHVRVFLNSNREGGAFQINESYFAQYELVNMPPAEVDTVNIYLVTDLEKQFGDNCSSPSIESFRDILNRRQLNYQCFDQPRDVLHLLCVDGNGSSDCVLKQDVQHSRTTEVAPQTTASARSLHEQRWSWFLFLASTAFAVYIPSFPRLS